VKVRIHGKSYTVNDVFKAITKQLQTDQSYVGSVKERVSALVQQLDRLQKMNLEVSDEVRESLAAVQGQAYLAAKTLDEADEAIAEALGTMQYEVGAN
jgi:signal transduction histidine kinase